MKTLDLDDLPPRLAQLLTSLDAGEELVLVQNGVVVSRLTGLTIPASVPEPPTSQERAAEVFEQFRSMMEDEF